MIKTLKAKNLLKNKNLAKHFADATWHNLIHKRECKVKEQDKHLVKIGQWFASSKTCSCCGHKVGSLPLSARHWECPGCHAQYDRDINAAINIC